MTESYWRVKERNRRTSIHTKAVRNMRSMDGPNTEARCRYCSELVTFTTDGNGHLLALDPSGKPHRHQKGA